MQLTSKGIRFLNYAFDTIGFFFIVMLHSLILDGIFHLVPEDGSIILGIYSLILYMAYHFVPEYYFGKTPAKFITGTKVVDVSGTRPNAKTLILRSVCRLNPLDSVSFLFSKIGLHDSISGTFVVNE